MLVLKEFTLNENAPTFLYIKGRNEGILAWALSKIGLDPITELVCDKQKVVCKSSSPKKGFDCCNAPLAAVTAVATGYRKAFMALVIAVVAAIGAIVGTAVLFFITNENGEDPAIAFISGGVCLLIAGIFFLTYVLSKRMYFGIYLGGNNPPLVSFQAKRSVIEGVTVDFDKFEMAAAALNNAVLACKTGGSAAASGAAVQASAPATVQASAPPQPVCKKCGAKEAVGAAFCGECGSPL